MIKVNKVHIKKIFEDTELGNSRLEFNIKGDNINYIIINTLRRTILSDIPIYAFTEFKFDKNTSIFHNNYLKLRLACLPIWNIENNVEFIEYDIVNKYEKEHEEHEEPEDQDENDDMIDMNTVETKNISASTTLKQLNMYINYKNKTNNIVSVTTNDAKFYYDEKQINSPYKNNIQLVKLQPNQEIAFSAITTIGTEQMNTIFSAVSIVTYKEVNNNEFNFILESKGQISEYKILKVAIINIIRKIKNFLKLLSENKDKFNTENVIDDLIEGTIEVHNEDHTLGNLITRGLQQHKYVKFAGYNLPHPLDKILIFHYSINKQYNIYNILEDIINYYIVLFTLIDNEFKKNL